ncbi:MAG: 2-C-methyl-D-erythritol 4-phosphate cytidylyltransferase [Phycisphaerae bacterium]|nr:2-C-methyl-D-erythritol 4-phosphate cytidylyltransferase [Phycisphaerae bacterium]
MSAENPTMRLAVIIPAAGASTRFAQTAARELGLAPDAPARSKLDEDLGGRPVLQRTVELFQHVPEVASIIVAGPADPSSMAAFRDRYADKLGLLGVRICAGGRDHRYQTVANALALVPQDCTHVAVHDAARPCTPAELIARVIDAAREHDAVVPGVDVSDTLKRTDPEPVAPAARDPLAAILGVEAQAPVLRRRVAATVDRNGLVAVQTPQVFRATLLRRAYAQADLSSTDDAQLVERLGEPVIVVEGDARNLKITRPVDLALARAILGVRPPAERPAHMRF